MEFHCVSPAHYHLSPTTQSEPGDLQEIAPGDVVQVFVPIGWRAVVCTMLQARCFVCCLCVLLRSD